MIAKLQTISATARALREGRTSSQAITEEALRLIATHASLNAFITTLETTSLDQARTADRELAEGLDRGPLHGIPVSLKDIIDLEGIPTTAASRVRDGHVASSDATLVSRLRNAGAVFIGKTNLHEFALGTTNEDSAFGPARHPLDPARSPGGSSGGSAVSVSTGMAFASIGTDTGGSIRIPAAACGVVGLKPTLGEVPLDGVVPLSSSFDHAGPICRSVDDAALVFDVIRGAPRSDRRNDCELGNLRLGIPRDYFLSLLDDEVAGHFDRTCATLARAGIQLSDAPIGGTETISPIYLHVSLPEAVAFHAATLDRMPEKYTPGVRLRLEGGRYLLSQDYVRAQQGRAVLRRAVDAVLERVDALLLPTLPIPAPEIGAVMVRVSGRDEPVRNMMLRLTQLFNVTGHPAIALPSGFIRSGLPVSLQLVGRHQQTDGLLDVARAVEAELARQWA